MTVLKSVCSLRVYCQFLFEFLLLFFPRALLVANYCTNNGFYILLSWLPTFFHENFPDAKVGCQLYGLTFVTELDICLLIIPGNANRCVVM